MRNLTKKQILMIACTAIAILSIILTVVIVDSNKEEHTVTLYSNQGIYFVYDRDYSYSSNGYIEYNYPVYEYQDTTIYQSITFNGKYPPEPVPPTHENGLVFLGWYQDPECTKEFIFGYHEVNSNINLYAKWIR